MLGLLALLLVTTVWARAQVPNPDGTAGPGRAPTLLGQSPSASTIESGLADASPATAPDTLPPPAGFDTLSYNYDTLPPPNISGVATEFTTSDDALDAPVTYAARDSMITDFVAKEIHLYGAAEVTYQQINLKANHIVLNYGTNIVFAEPLPDSTGRPAGLPQFSDGGQDLTAREMRYNFKTKKGIVYGTTTTQDDIFVRGGKSKFVSGAIADTDSTRSDVIYSTDAIFTTCSAEHPHFGIRTQKAKVVPNRLAVIGPSHLEIMGVPTPFWLPFGFFPLKSGRSTGLLFPSDYQFSPQWGYGLQGVGWFFPLGDHVNLQLTADYYIKGTYTLNTNVRYTRRYKYSGSFNASFKRLRRESAVTQGLEESFNRGVSVNWSHRQDARAHPTFNFGGSINFQTNLVDQRFINSYEVASQNTIRSSMNLTKTFPKLKSTLTAGLNHSQNNNSRVITMNFPDAAFQTQTIYPFRGVGGPSDAWYKQVNFRYRSALRTELESPDSTFFTQATLDDAQYGFQHSLTSGLSLSVLKYFTLNPSVSFEEVYYGKSRNYGLDGLLQTQDIVDPETGAVRIDTTSLGSITNDLRPGLASYREFSASVSLQTQVFGKVRFKGKGLFGLQGIRHVVKPRISLQYAPDYQNAVDYITGTRYYIPEREIDPLNGREDRRLSPFSGQIFGAPPDSEQRLGIGYSIGNVFQAKVWDKKDSTSKNIVLLQDVGINGSFDFTKDSLKWSTVRMGTTTSFFKGVTRLNVSAIFDPYITRYNAEQRQFKRVDVFHASEGRFPLALDNLSMTVATGLTVAKIRQLFQGAEEEYVEDVQAEREKQREKDNALFEETDILSLFERFSINHTFRFGFVRTFDVDDPDEEDRGEVRFTQQANSIDLRGALQLTNNWSINIGNIGYDFTTQRITYPYLQFVRDLHCWEMRFSWAPQRNTYQFSIAVKPGTLDFINIPQNQNRYDGGRLFGNEF